LGTDTNKIPAQTDDFVNKNLNEKLHNEKTVLLTLTLSNRLHW